MGLRKELKSLQNAVTRLEKRLYDLTRQVQCGNEGHEFRLFCLSEIFTDERTVTTEIFGNFECGCGAKTVRRLNDYEIESAKKLGFSV